MAGSGKTTYIVDFLNTNKRVLIVTYTDNNYENLREKILHKFQGIWPENITLMSYFDFLYRFCYKPFMADEIRAKGITYQSNINRYVKQSAQSYYISPERYLYSNRLALLLDRKHIIPDIKNRIETYFDEFIIDEIQDIAGRDFNFLDKLMEANVNMLFVGDFFQHIYDTSRDGNVNKSLFNDKSLYEKCFLSKGFAIDTDTLKNSWRCGKRICEFVTENLGIQIYSNFDNGTLVQFISDRVEVDKILANNSIIKLRYNNSTKYIYRCKNWGETKGEDCYQDVCVILNKETMKKFKSGNLLNLKPSTRNKLYVAITRAHGNVFLIEDMASKMKRWIR